jgi:hypothetical protein
MSATLYLRAGPDILNCQEIGIGREWREEKKVYGVDGISDNQKKKRGFSHAKFAGLCKHNTHSGIDLTS